MNVHVLVYTYRHGVDVHVYASNELLLQGAASIIWDNLDGVEDVVARATIRLHMSDGKWMDVLKRWETYQNERTSPEDMESFECEVIGL